MNNDFVSAFKWDHYSQIIFDRLCKHISHMEWELGELADQNPGDMISLLHYYQKWHYNKELFQETRKEATSRRYVIEKMLDRGYGVNIDLARALNVIEKEKLNNINQKLGETFYRKIHMVQSMIFMPQENITNYDSLCIISELCKKLGYPIESHIPVVPPACPEKLKFEEFFNIRDNTPENVKFSVFKKMFLTLGETSKTIMKGTIGYENYYSPQYLKIVARQNLISLFNEIYVAHFDSLRINVDLLRRIHYILYIDLDTPYTCMPGEFRSFDFDDKNGVTVEQGRLLEEVGVLEGYMERINWHTWDPYELIRGLSEVYHLIIAVHPFSDANGRVGKCFVNYIMMVKGLPPIIFADEEEVLSLPRYGSSLLDIESYFKNRIAYSIDYYIREISKIERNGNLYKEIRSVYFDSGFHFREYVGYPLVMEINFMAYITPYELIEEYLEECKIAVTDENSLYNLTLYCGLCHEELRWEKEFSLKGPLIEELYSHKPGVRIFDITFYLCLYENEHINYKSIEFSVVSPLTGQIFNNKGLNYFYKF